MRVITGKAKGHRLSAPKGVSVRPTTDRIKESLFNIIGEEILHSIVLDVFSGSGSIGIEFLSRGAKSCYFVDSSISSIKVIKENLLKTKLMNEAHILKQSTASAIDFLHKMKLNFDFVFMDPPYEEGFIIKTLEHISHTEILRNNGVIIAEHESKLDLPMTIGAFHKTDSRRYGSTTITFFRMEM